MKLKMLVKYAIIRPVVIGRNQRMKKIAVDAMGRNKKKKAIEETVNQALAAIPDIAVQL